MADSALVTPTVLIRVAGVLGGLAWPARAVVDRHGGSDAVVNTLHWGGVALIAVALVGIGAGLVSGLPALRVLVAVCLAALVWSVLVVARGQWDEDWVDGTFGVLLVVFCVVGLVRAARRRDPARATRARGTGTHAA